MAALDYEILRPMIDDYIAESGLRVSPRLSTYERAERVLKNINPAIDAEQIEATLTLLCLQFSSDCCGGQCHSNHTSAPPAAQHGMRLRSHTQTHMTLRNGRSIKHAS